MHYSDGTPAKVGDLISCPVEGGKGALIAVVAICQAEQATCDVRVLPLAVKFGDVWTAHGDSVLHWHTAKECRKLL